MKRFHATKNVLRIALAAFLVSGCPLIAPAQSPESVTPGERVRVRHYYGEWVAGTFAGVGGDTIFVHVEGEPTVRPYRGTVIENVQVSSGRRLSSTRGAVLGGVAGVAAGLVAVAVASDDSDCPPEGGLGTPGCTIEDEDDIQPLAVIAGSAAVGIGLGFLTAKLLGERWSEVDTDALIEVGANHDGFGVTLRW